jgi:hypothetical protein
MTLPYRLPRALRRWLWILQIATFSSMPMLRWIDLYAGWMIVVCVGWVVLGLRLWSLRTNAERRRLGLCVRCGYDIRHCGASCSECGVRVKLPARVADALQRWERRRSSIDVIDPASQTPTALRDAGPNTVSSPDRLAGDRR